MRAIVSGGAGFLGSHLCEALVAEGHEVLALDNLCTGSIENLEQLKREARFTFEQVDVTQSFDFGQADFIYHLASPASPVDYAALGIETLMVGSLGTQRLLEAAKSSGAGFLLASTSECYGDPLEHPQKETYWGNVNPVGPRSVYDEAKRFAEALTMAYHRYHGVRTRIARIFNTYGPRMRVNDGRVIPNLMVQALSGQPLTIFGDGSQTRSFCYVSDEVDGLLRLARHDHAEPVNIGNPREFTILECAQEVLRVTGSTSPLTYGNLPTDDPQQRRPDITKARKLLGWEPRIELREGLQLSLDYFREKGAGKSPAARES